MDLRTEVKDFSRMAERLIGFARRVGELSDDECGVVMYYAKDLERVFAPLCPNHCEHPASTVQKR
jgi:hypothetical protein